MDIKKLKLNDKNPRFIKDDKFQKLVKSISEFPKMMELRPIVYDPESFEILGGNMRYRALVELKYKKIPDEWVKSADQLTEDEKKRFIIEDNVSFGEWDMDILANEWDNEQLSDWGVELPLFTGEINDIEQVNDFKESVSFTIECDNMDEFEKLQSKLNVSEKKISFKEFCLKVGF